MKQKSIAKSKFAIAPTMFKVSSQVRYSFLSIQPKLTICFPIAKIKTKEADKYGQE